MMPNMIASTYSVMVAPYSFAFLVELRCGSDHVSHHAVASLGELGDIGEIDLSFCVVVLFGIHLKAVFDLGGSGQIAIVLCALVVFDSLARLDLVVSCKQTHKESRAACAVRDAMEKLASDSVIAVHHSEKIAFAVKRNGLERIKALFLHFGLERQSLKIVPERAALDGDHKRGKSRHEIVKCLLQNLAVHSLFHHRRKAEERAVFV